LKDEFKGNNLTSLQTTENSVSNTQMHSKEYFETNGYIVFSQLVPAERIDTLLTLYQRDIVPSCHPFFRQNTNRYEPNQLNEFGFVKQAFLDIHDYQTTPEFSSCAKEIFCSTEIHQALREITGSSACHLMQTMMFDANTETPPHQDWWYLDSVPNGHLLAAWIALEDIDERAGRFYVLPKTTKIDLHSDTPDLPHSQWLQRIHEYVNVNCDHILAPALKKGDVLFWNSRTIHGALPTTDAQFSRKSLTAHYLPCEYDFGNLFVCKKHIQYQEYQGIKYYRNQPDYSLMNHLKFRVKTAVYDSPALLKMLRKLQLVLSQKH
jgi:phytanoyl-CoA hydroxylase